MVVDFAVENDAGLPAIFEDGLIAAFEINNFEARGTKGKRIGSEYALLIGPSMDEGLHHFPESFRGGLGIFMCKSGYAAQMRGVQSTSRIFNPIAYRLRCRAAT